MSDGDGPATREKTGPRVSRAWWILACAALAVVAGLYVLHLQPGVTRRGREARTCRINMGRMATALLQHARSTGSYPASLDALPAAGQAAEEALSHACPVAGAYRYRGGLAPDMPLGTILCWEEGKPHIVTYPERGRYLVYHLLTCSLRVESMAQPIYHNDEEQALRTLDMILEDRLADQKRGVSLHRRIEAGDEGAWKDVSRALRSRGRSMTRAFAAYAVGRHGRTALAPSLVAIVAQSDGRCMEPAYSAAYALARLGRTEGAAILVQGLGHREYLVRRTAFESLKALAGEDFGFLPYRSPEQQPEAVERWMAWAIRTRS